MDRLMRAATSKEAARLCRAIEKPNIAARSLFIRVQPPPRSLSERRAVLRAMQRYGEVDMFKKLAVGYLALLNSTNSRCIGDN